MSCHVVLILVLQSCVPAAEGPQETGRRVQQLVDMLHQVKSLEEGKKLLEEKKELLGLGLVLRLGDAAEELLRSGKLEQAALLAGLQREAAGHAKDGRALAAALHTQGRLHLVRGEPLEALDLHRRALRLCAECHDLEGEVQAHCALADILLDVGKPEEALAHARRAAVLGEKCGRRWLVLALLRLGQVLRHQGEYDAAVREYRRALELALAGKEVGLVLALLNDLASVEQRRGNTDEARRLWEKALELAQGQGGALAAAGIRVNLGRVYLVLGRLDEARKLFEAAEKTFAQAGRQGEVLRTRINLGLVYLDSGEYELALDLYRELARAARASGEQRVLAAARANLGETLRRLGRHGEALPHLTAALEMCREGGDRYCAVRALNNLGLACFYTGQLRLALGYLEKAVAVARQLGDRRAEALALHNLGLAQDAGGMSGAALAAYQQARTLAREVGSRETAARAAISIALHHGRAGRLREAEQGLRAELDADPPLGLPLLEVQLRHRLGVVLVERGRLEEAEGQLRRALAEARKLSALQEIVEAEAGLGHLFARKKEWRQAEARYRLALEAVERQRAEAREPTLQTSLFSTYSHLYGSLVRCLLEREAPVAEIFTLTELARGRTVGEILQQGQVDVSRGMSAEARQREQQLLRSLRVLTRALETEQQRGDGDPRRIEQLAVLQQQARDELDVFRRTLYLGAPELRVQRGQLLPATLDEAGGQLLRPRPGSALLSYFLGDDYLLVLLLAPQKDGKPRLVARRQDVSVKQLEREVADLRHYCTSPADTTGFDLERLHRWLIAPVADALPDRGHLVIVPDGILHTLPFHLLPGKEGRPLLETHGVSYAPSVTALLEMVRLARRRHELPPGGRHILLAGRPSFGPGLKDLPATETEVRQIAGLFGDEVVLLQGRQATRRLVTEKMSGARLIHLATHGLIRPLSPMYSAVALTREGDDDGLLTARDLMGLGLRAEMVVLSACETALGEEVAGEGILGLTWALFAGGTPTSVVTQWSVHDASTSALMTSFYRRLRAEKGITPAEALRQAQLEVRKERRYRHPHYWAPFVLWGEWQ